MVKKDGSRRLEIRVPESLYARLAALAEAERRSMNGQIVKMLEAATVKPAQS